MQMIVLKARARLIWNETTALQRRGHFAMGVGLDSGLKIDKMAEVLADDLDQADLAALKADINTLHALLVRLAEKLLVIRPFVPDASNTLKDNWEEVLLQWIKGEPLSAVEAKYAGMIEDTFAYRLVWALEAIRVRRFAHGWKPEIGTIPGAAAACLDTGLPDYRMTLLVRAGLSSRYAARSIVNELDPRFLNGESMRRWLSSNVVAKLSLQDDWPSETTVLLWRRFRNEMLSDANKAWSDESESFNLDEIYDVALPDRTSVRVEPDLNGRKAWLKTPDFRVVGRLDVAITDVLNTVTYAELELDSGKAHIRRIGPDN